MLPGKVMSDLSADRAAMTTKWSALRKRLGAGPVNRFARRSDDPREVRRLAVEALIDAHYETGGLDAAAELTWLENHDDAADAVAHALLLKGEIVTGGPIPTNRYGWHDDGDSCIGPDCLNQEHDPEPATTAFVHNLDGDHSECPVCHAAPWSTWKPFPASRANDRLRARIAVLEAAIAEVLRRANVAGNVSVDTLRAALGGREQTP